MKALHNTTAAMADNTAVVYVKNMVCRRRIIAGTEVFKEHGIKPVKVEQGTEVLPTTAGLDKIAANPSALDGYDL